MPKLIIRHRRRRLVPDLEKEYRRTLGQYMWGALGAMVLLQLLCLPPLYIFGPFFWIPVAVCPPLIILGTWLFSQPLTQPVENAPPKIYYTALAGVSVALFFAGLYFMKADYLVGIADAESRAKTHLATLGEIVGKALAPKAKDDEEEEDEDKPAGIVPRRIDGDWSDPEYFPEIPESYRRHLSRSIPEKHGGEVDAKDSTFNGQFPEAFTEREPLDGYYYFYACRPTGSWVIWCESAHYPRGGRKLFVTGHKGLMLSRDVKGLHINFKSFPSSLQQARFQSEGKFSWAPPPASIPDEEEEAEEADSTS
ncbi:MAG: hypothetical protein AB7F75_08855 [Planctomycetota bacterium]